MTAYLPVRAALLVSCCLIALVGLASCGGSPTSPTREIDTPADTPAPSSDSPAPALSRVTAQPETVTGGSTAQGTATLTGASPDGGTTVMLSSSDGVASVPGTLTIPAGATSGEFTITTTIVATEMPVTISASLGSETKSAVITGAADGRSQTRDDSPVLQDHEELLNRLKPSLCAASRNPDVIKFVCRLS